MYTRKLEVVHKKVGGCTQGIWRLYTRMLAVVSSHIPFNKEVGVYIALNDESSVTQSVTYVGIKLLWQLKMSSFSSYIQRCDQPWLCVGLMHTNLCPCTSLISNGASIKTHSYLQIARSFLPLLLICIAFSLDLSMIRG